jgi:hypothetical protein
MEVPVEAGRGLGRLRDVVRGTLAKRRAPKTSLQESHG